MTKEQIKEVITCYIKLNLTEYHLFDVGITSEAIEDTFMCLEHLIDDYFVTNFNYGSSVSDILDIIEKDLDKSVDEYLSEFE